MTTDTSPDSLREKAIDVVRGRQAAADPARQQIAQWLLEAATQWESDRRRLEEVEKGAETRVAPSEIERQRERGWSDWHPEAFCHRCGTRNVTAWSVESRLWNRVVRREGSDLPEIVCPQCFVEAFAAQEGGNSVWELRLSNHALSNTQEPSD